MNPKWAEENLQTIRTLMERSALYRRALAPIMTFVGLVGIAGGSAGVLLQIKSLSGFLWLWLGLAVVSLTGAMLLVRQQALKDSEPFWSPPTRRIAQALLPGFFIGFTLWVLAVMTSRTNPDPLDDYLIPKILMILWVWLYGCALNAAGFFMPRGVRWLGWLFLISGVVMLGFAFIATESFMGLPPNFLMAFLFGGLHFAYGIYLYFTEQKNPVA